MANLNFAATQSKNKIEEDFTTNKGKKRVIRFKGTQNNGIVVEINIEGPEETVNKMIATFPLGKGIPYLISVDSTQKTIADQLLKLTKTTAKDPKDGKPTTATGQKTLPTVKGKKTAPAPDDEDDSDDQEDDQDIEDEPYDKSENDDDVEADAQKDLAKMADQLN